MTLAKEIRNRVLELKEGTVVTLADFGLPAEQQPALNVTLNRLVAEGVLKRLSKGRFYREKKSVFGTLSPNEMEVVKDFLVKNGQTVGYITGTQAFAEMGLTTQISSKLLVGTNKYRRAVKRGDYMVSFLLQPNPIKENEIEMYRLLDALRLVREIPATTPDEAVRFLMGLLERMTEEDRLLCIRIETGVERCDELQAASDRAGARKQKEMEYRMNLHEDTELFAELLTAASQPEERGGLGIRQAFLEKDYWVTRSLQMLAESRFAEQAVFKGGTSLSKAFGMGFRFSEDIDIAIVADETRKDNQTKALVGGIARFGLQTCT